MKEVLVIAHFCNEFDGLGNNRFNYLAYLFSSSGYNVEFVTSDFSHTKKRKKNVNVNADLGFKVTYLKEPYYKDNISLRRVFAHRSLAKELKDYLSSRKPPDVVYCAVPSLSIASVAAKYSRKNKVRFLIDVQDLWPEAFYMAIKLGPVNDIIFKPLSIAANKIYSSADVIVSVSDEYRHRALAGLRKAKPSQTIYLGTDLSSFDQYVSKIKFNNGFLNLVYVGTLGYSYDLKTVFDAMSLVKDETELKVNLIVLGDGPLEKDFMAYAKKKEVDVDFKGRLSYGQMIEVLTSCDIAVNPITKGAAGSIINKHADYAAAGLPVLNTQECAEYRKMLAKYGSGINCNNEDSRDLANKIIELAKDEELRALMGRNSRRMAEELFDRNITYPKLLKHIG